MKKTHVFFFRGLSTYGADNAKWSVFDFGPIHKHLAREFGRREVELHAVTGMGAGTLREVAERARFFLAQHPVWQDRNTPVHFIGHSAGGLVARLLVEQGDLPPGKVASVLTVATPHRGAALAQLCLDMPTCYKGSAGILKGFGYDIASRRGFFDELTASAVNRLFQPPRKSAGNARVASIVCHAPRSEWCLPLKMFYKVKAFADFNLPSDGVVERDTQPYGDVIAELNIDHFRQVGLFGEARRFHHMCDVATDYFRTS